MERVQRQPDRERGAILIHVAIALIALMGFSAFVIDYGVFWVSRRQAQNAADAGALAGAISLAYDDYDNRDADGPAQLSALEAARANMVFGSEPSVNADEDVTFPPCPDDATDACIKVDVYRNVERDNPLPIFMGALVGLVDQDVQATATAKVASGNAADCLRPFAVPDLPYNLDDHWGTTVEFRDNPGDATGPGWFRIIDVIDGDGGGGTGNETWPAIRTCAADVTSVGETLTEQGGVVGNLHTHINAMVDLDPDASVDADTHEVIDSCAETRSCDRWVAGNGANFDRVADPGRSYSPRIVPIAVYDEAEYLASGTLVVTNIFGFFLLPAQGPPDFALRGVIVTQPGLRVGEAGTVDPESSFVKVIQLIR